MVIFAGNLLLTHREDSFGALSIFLVIMIFANLHWLSSARYKDYIRTDRINGEFLKIAFFKLMFFWLVYNLSHLFGQAKRVIFRVFWFEVGRSLPDHVHSHQAVQTLDGNRMQLVLQSNRQVRFRVYSAQQIDIADL